MDELEVHRGPIIGVILAGLKHSNSLGFTGRRPVKIILFFKEGGTGEEMQIEGKFGGAGFPRQGMLEGYMFPDDSESFGENFMFYWVSTGPEKPGNFVTGIQVHF